MKQEGDENEVTVELTRWPATKETEREECKGEKEKGSVSKWPAGDPKIPLSFGRTQTNTQGNRFQEIHQEEKCKWPHQDRGSEIIPREYLCWKKQKQEWKFAERWGSTDKNFKENSVGGEGKGRPCVQ